MLELSGTLIRKPRAQIKSPNDGVHRNGANGFLKGAHAMYLNEKFMPHGQVSMYYWESGDTGLKLFVNAKNGRKQKLKYVEAVRDRMKRYYKKGVAPKPGKIIPVKVDFQFKEKMYCKTVWALEVQHLYWTEDFEDYANGMPLVWQDPEVSDYNPEGYKKFKKKLDKILSHETKKVLKKTGDSYKIGDVMYCTKRQEWKMVDWG